MIALTQLNQGHRLGSLGGDAPGYVASHGTVRMQTVHYTLEILDVHSLYIHLNIIYWYTGT